MSKNTIDKTGDFAVFIFCRLMDRHLEPGYDEHSAMKEAWRLANELSKAKPFARSDPLLLACRRAHTWIGGMSFTKDCLPEAGRIISDLHDAILSATGEEPVPLHDEG